MKLAFALVLVIVGLLLSACGLSRRYYVNVSPSLPQQGYWLWGMPERRGDVALGCLDEQQRYAAAALSSDLVATTRCGRAPGLLKIVVGLPGDHVHVDKRGVWIAGRLLLVC
jgi:type IV secretory pathway protease TraF